MRPTRSKYTSIPSHSLAHVFLPLGRHGNRTCISTSDSRKLPQTAKRRVRKAFLPSSLVGLSAMVPFAFVVRPTHSPLPFPSLLSLLIFLRLRIFPLLRFHLSRVWGGRTFESPFNLLIMRQGEWPFSFLLRSSSFLLFFFPLPLSLHLSSQLERELFKFFQQPHYFGQRESSHPRSDHLELALSSFFVPYVRPLNSSLSGRPRTCGSDTGTHAWRISLGRSAFTRT